MSDTPRTDAFCKAKYDAACAAAAGFSSVAEQSPEDAYGDAVEFAKGLERDLETCRDAHMANCLAADTLRTEIRALREKAAHPEGGRWIPVTERLPEAGGWYGVLDAQGEKGAAMFHSKSGGWIHDVVEPIQAWCHFPPPMNSRPLKG